jgi:hypothetical protein
MKHAPSEKETRLTNSGIGLTIFARLRRGAPLPHGFRRSSKGRKRRLFDYTRQAQHSQELLEFSWRTDCHSTLYVIGSVLGDDLASGLMGRLDMSNLRDARRPSQEVDKVRDLMREVTYERRVVAFYDVLGWRRHIRRAGNKASDVSLLPANPQDGASDTRRKGSGSSGQHVLRQRGD